MMLLGRMLASAVALVTGLAGATAFASEPQCWQYKVQPAVTPVMERFTEFHQLLLLIFTLITVPSFKLLYLFDVVQKADMTFKAIGNQWYWTDQSMLI